ncbi:MAG: transposase [Ignavibacterium sp.]|jgi:REP element-mobilizing transposase RayT|uniref:REP-associated tyrosine transposase n=1 Tax=Ignavibacterium sp. TaxID=2651167 RepID=UPI003297B947
MNKIFHRRHLPHLHFNDGIYFITSRLYDPELFTKFDKEYYINHPNQLSNIDFQTHFVQYDEILNTYKSQIDYLKNPEIAEILLNEFHKLDGKEYNLIAYTILSNHFHLLFELLVANSGISKIMKMIKGRSSVFINRKLNRTGKLWQDESYDRWVRDDKELYFVIRYILENPVKAGLVKNWRDWKFTYCKQDFIVI